MEFLTVFSTLKIEYLVRLKIVFFKTPTSIWSNDYEKL